MTEFVLICGGLLVVCVFLYAVYTLVSHPVDVDAEEKAAVDAESPAEHARAMEYEHRKTAQEESDADGQLYGHEDSRDIL